jgi:hypothetical protein
VAAIVWGDAVPGERADVDTVADLHESASRRTGLAHLPGYSAWRRGQDWTGAYRRHRRNLQLIGLPDAGRRWVLKNPSHLFALDALLDVYPGRAGDPDPPVTTGRDRLGVQPGRPGH